MSVHFLYFLFKWEGVKELNQQVCLIEYVENETSNSTSHKKRKKERERERERERAEQKHHPTSKTFLKLLKIFH